MTKSATIETVEQLEDLLSEPTDGVVETMRRLKGDILFLGAGGKIGPSLARMARRASDLGGVSRRIIAISRFSARDEEVGCREPGSKPFGATCSMKPRSRTFRTRRTSSTWPV